MCIRPREEERVVLCTNEEGMRGLYSDGVGFRVRPLGLGLGGKEFEFLR